jgi:hypothetical protein
MAVSRVKNRLWCLKLRAGCRFVSGIFGRWHVASQQLTMFVSDYEKLVDARDMAAYRCVGALTAAICFCRQRDTDAALSILTSALARYESAAEKLEALKTHKGENHAVHSSN